MVKSFNHKNLRRRLARMRSNEEVNNEFRKIKDYMSLEEAKLFAEATTAYTERRKLLGFKLYVNRDLE